MSIGRFGDEPDFVNGEGVKWWLVSGNIWMVELPSGEREYVGIRDGEIIASGTQLDAVAIKLEMTAHAEAQWPHDEEARRQARVEGHTRPQDPR